MKKRTFRCATQTGVKLLFSILALLLVLTGCNTPTPPQEELPTGTEQPTELPTEQPTELPTEQPTEEPMNVMVSDLGAYLWMLDFNHLSDFDAFRKKYQQENEHVFYTLDPNRFEGNILGYSVYATNTYDPLNPPYHLSDYSTQFTCVANEMTINGHLIIHNEQFTAVSEMTDELFKTRTVSGKYKSDTYYATIDILLGGIPIATVKCERQFSSGQFSSAGPTEWRIVAQKVADALVWAYRDQGGFTVEEIKLPPSFYDTTLTFTFSSAVAFESFMEKYVRDHYNYEVVAPIFRSNHEWNMKDVEYIVETDLDLRESMNAVLEDDYSAFSITNIYIKGRYQFYDGDQYMGSAEFYIEIDLYQSFEDHPYQKKDVVYYERYGIYSNVLPDHPAMDDAFLSYGFGVPKLVSPESTIHEDYFDVYIAKTTKSPEYCEDLLEEIMKATTLIS